MSANKTFFNGPEGIVVPRLTADPGAGINGEMYYNTTDNKFRVYQNGAWADSGGGGDWWLNAVPNDTYVLAEDNTNASLNIFKISSTNQLIIGPLPGGEAIYFGTGGIITIDTNGAGTGTFQVQGAVTELYGDANTVPQELRFFDGDNSNYIGLKPATTIASDFTLILPPADGANGQALTTDGSGNLAFNPIASMELAGATFIPFWGTDIPSIIFDGTTAAATAAFATAIIHKGNGNQSDFLIVTEDQTTTVDPSSGIYISTGHTDTGLSGYINIFTGEANGASTNSGDIDISSGAVTSGTSGNINIITGEATASGGATGQLNLWTSPVAVGTGVSGLILIQTGSNSDTGDSGPATFRTGETLSGTSGVLTINSGDVTTGTSGAVILKSGLANTGSTGSVTISSGANSNTGSTGAVSLKSGASTVGGATGNVEIGSGGNAGSGNTGNVVITTGYTPSGTVGKIKILPGGASATVGYVWTSTNVDGSGSWQAVPATGANAALSNLAATNINEDLLFKYDKSTAPIVGGKDHPSAASQSLTIKTGAAASTFDTGAITIQTGNATGAGGDSGSITLQTGTSASSTRGDVILNANKFDVTSITEGKGIAVWKKYTKTYTDFSTAATTNSITLFSLPAYGVIHNVVISHSTAFSGGALATYTVEVGISGNTSKYASAFDVFQATGAGVGQTSSVSDFESKSGSTTIQVTATSTGANLSAATAGSVDIWVLWGTMQ